MRDPPTPGVTARSGRGRWRARGLDDQGVPAVAVPPARAIVRAVAERELSGRFRLAAPAAVVAHHDEDDPEQDERDPDGRALGNVDRGVAPAPDLRGSGRDGFG